MTSVEIQLGVYAAQLIFFLGGLYFLIKQLRKDLNGVGCKVRAIDERADDRFFITAIVLLIITPDDKRIEIAKLLAAAGKGKNR